ncbi:MAG: hypothetical protein K0Q93_3281 [Nocardioidaceae bacterium]|nr:hypothetical protein [Nocardioidaceae bacterium]
MPAAVWPITCRRLTNRAELGNQPVTDVEGRKVHRLSLIAAMLALLLSGPAGIAAQDSTPEASGSALAALGYPEDVTDEQVVADLGPDAESPPPWLFEAIYPGFPGETLPGQTNLALVDLSPGRYIVLGDTVQQFEVVGDAATPGATPEAERSVVDGTVRLFDFNFEFPDTVAAGRQLWEVTNTGEQPHELLLARSPEPVTAEQVMELMAGESEEATPTGGGPSFANFEPVGGIGWLSPGLTALTEIDLEPGTYVALCFVFDPETGLPHVALGMVAVFTVGEGTATPVA